MSYNLGILYGFIVKIQKQFFLYFSSFPRRPNISIRKTLEKVRKSYSFSENDLKYEITSANNLFWKEFVLFGNNLCSRQQLGLKSQPPIKSVSYAITWPSMKNVMDVSYALSRSLVLLISHVHSDSANSPRNPRWEMDKTFSSSYSPSQITYVEAETLGFSRFRFHRKRTASSFRFHVPDYYTTITK